MGKKETPNSSGSLTIYNPTTGTATTYTAGGSSSQSVSQGAMALGSAGGGVTVPSTSVSTSSGRSGGGGGGSGGGYSYVDTTTGKGYEVSPTGIKTEVKVDRGSTFNRQQLNKGRDEGFTRASSRENILESNKRANEIDTATRQAQERYDRDVKDFAQSRTDYYKNLINDKKIYAPSAYEKLNKEIKEYSKDYGEALTEQLNRDVQGIVVNGDTQGSSGGTTNLYFDKKESMISAVPTYKELVKSESKATGSSILGFLGGTSQYIQRQVTAQRYISANKGNLGTYQPEATGRAAGLFFDMNPVSGVLYGLGSVEQLVRKSGRESLGSQYESRITGGFDLSTGKYSEGESNIKSGIKTYGVPILGTGLTVFGVSKGTKYLGEVSTTKKVQRAVNELSNAPIEDVAVVWRGTGKEANKVQVQAVQRAGNFERRIVMSGKLIEGDGGMSFIPEGSGRYVGGGTISKSRLFGKDYSYLEGGTFKFGGVGKVKPLFNIGDVQVGTSYSSSFMLPKTSTYSIRQVPSTLSKGRNIVSERIVGGTPEINIRGGIKPSIINDELVLTGENFMFSKGSISYEQSTVGKGVTINMKSPISAGEEVGKIYGSSKKTPFSTTFGEQVVSTETKIIPSTITRTIKTPTITIQKPVIEGSNIPFMIGGLGLKTLPSPTKNVVFEEISRVSLNIPNNNVLVPTEDKLTTSSIINLDTKSNIILKPMSLTITPQKETYKSRTNVSSIVKPLETTKEIQKYVPSVKQIPRQINLLKPQNKSIQRIVVKPKITTKVIPVFIPPKIPTSSSFVDRVKSGESKLFEAFAFKGEKPISIGKASSQEEAESLLKGTLKSTLRAGGFLTKGGEKIKASELKGFGGGEFRLSKVSKYNIVEQKNLRLRKSGTGSQIQYFR